MKFKYILFLIGAGLSACSFHEQLFVTSTPIVVDSLVQPSSRIDSIISPYRVELEAEMSKVITSAGVDFVNQRPVGNLGNLVADVLHTIGKNYSDTLPVFTLLNYGGLRSPLNQGAVTVGDVFKLMPFDNQLVLVKMPAKSISEIQAYLRKSGGEPISGILFQGNEILQPTNLPWPTTDFWIITSDYLMNGGDKMIFFTQKIEVIQTGLLLREVILSEFSKEHVLKSNLDQRIKW
jgi:2',3'-cyclic-nucleotide 2'-phosphodiesterase (5'-nucleotidase family)